MRKIFKFINNKGFRRYLIVSDIPEDDKLFVMLMSGGKIYKTGYMLRDEINQFLDWHNVKGRV